MIWPYFRTGSPGWMSPSATLCPNAIGSRTSTARPATPSVADLCARFDAVLVRRIVLTPTPGTATVDDVVAIHDRENRLCELVDGVLVEKVMGYYESNMACILIHILMTFLDRNRLGVV